MNELLLSFYGDDFTGSTDAMEALSIAGVRTVLFLDPPDSELLSERFSDLRALGIAGISRSWTPGQMEEFLRPAFGAIKQLGAPVFHYKTCSTFDSSPEIGSIGRAIDIGQELFHSRFVPLVVGAPALRRYTLFGNLFATVGDESYRLDRHPTMAHHPITPMDEADLRLHLARQTATNVALFDIVHQTGTSDVVAQRFEALLDTRPDIVLFDVLDDARLSEVGRLIWSHRGAGPLFAAGSSGVEYALTAHWRATGLVPQPQPVRPAGPVEQLVVISGSCSPETQQQIDWALEHGFAGIALDTVDLVNPATAPTARDSAIRAAERALGQGQSVVLHTSVGPHDARIAATARVLTACGLDRTSMGQQLGRELGRILRTLLERTGLRRAVVAGGDTSGHASLHLGIYALEMVTPIAPGSPLCRAYSHIAHLDGLEIALKGGQVGKADYFGKILRGSA